MFDKLIVSEPESADIKNRSSYFLITSVVVGVLFVTGVVISIFASDYGLGTDNFELVKMIAPVESAAVAPEPPKPQPRLRSSSTAAAPPTAVPTRKVVMANINESPVVPKEISTAPNTVASRPPGKYEIAERDSDPIGGGRSGRSQAGDAEGPGTLVASAPVEVKPPPIPEPPPVKAQPVAKPVTKSLGVINGLATNLPKPNYPPAAKAVNIQGKVDVQVLIDETGKVVSAKALSGNALLRDAAVSAARQARFTPTTLSNVPVKVTGVIVYNFTRS